MTPPSHQGGSTLDGELSAAEPRFDRRTAVLRAGCLVFAAMFPGSAHAAAASRPRSRAAVAQLLSQSPIDLRRDDVTFVKRLPRIGFAYPRSVGVLLRNTGAGEFDTVRAELPAGAAHIILGGMRWELLQFHWHTPSEHELEGRNTPMEMHFVHMRADGAILVLAVFITRGKQNRALEPMFGELPEPGHTRDVSAVRVKSLLPESRESFRYSGSLTTPPFTEPVRFVVFAEPICASRRQIGAFRELYEEGNSREVQPLNGRELLSDAKDRCEDDDD